MTEVENLGQSWSASAVGAGSVGGDRAELAPWAPALAGFFAATGLTFVRNLWVLGRPFARPGLAAFGSVNYRSGESLPLPLPQIGNGFS